MIVANLLSGLTEVYLGNEGIAQVYYGDNLIWPEDITKGLKMLFITDMGEEGSFDCSHTGTSLITYVDYPSSALTDSEILDLATEMSGQTVTSITLGECTEEIVDYAFSFRGSISNKNYNSIKTSVTQFDMGAGVIKVGKNAFSNGGNSNWGQCLTTFKFSPKLQSIGEAAFTYLTKVRNFSLPESLISIDKNAFSYCTSASFSFGSQIQEIGESAFASCTSMRKIEIPDATTAVGQKAFQGCSAVISLSIGSGLNTINANTFYGCTSLKRVDIPDTVMYINTSAFANCTSLSAVTIGNGCRTIGGSAFKGDTRLESVSMGNSVTSINSDVFSGCTSLKNISFSNALDSVGGKIFNGCSSLEEVVFPDSVYSIGSNCFDTNCTALTSVTYGSGIAVIGGNELIKNCQKITCKAIVPPTLNGSLTSYVSDYKIYVPSESVEDYKAANTWSNYADHIFAITE